MALPRKTRRRQKHQVDMNVKVRDITKAGTSLDLDVFADGEKLGNMVIGSGSINWRGRNRRSTKRITWTRFAEMMDRLAYGE
jgi:hypothetical protein